MRREVRSEVKLRRNLSTPENREFWDFVSKTAKDVRENFPLWKVSEETAKRFKLEREKLELDS